MSCAFLPDVPHSFLARFGGTDWSVSKRNVLVHGGTAHSGELVVSTHNLISGPS